jgi:hypothetical protein
MSPVGSHDRVTTEYHETGMPIQEHTCLECGVTVSDLYELPDECSVGTGSVQEGSS